MKILHTSDWHLGQHFMGKSRRDEHAAFITWLLALIKQESIDALIIAGDIFDTGSPPSYAREMYHQLVLDLKAVDCQLVIVGGNHDSVSMLNESKSLLSYLGTHVLAQAQLDDIDAHVIPLFGKDKTIGAWVCAVPYLRPRDVMQSLQGQSEQGKKQALMTHIGEFYQSVYDLAVSKNNALDKPVPIIGTGHLTAMGGQLSESVRDLYVGTLESLPTSVFPKFDYLALGHIHRPQAITKDGRFRYSGSPIPLSFDELGRYKTVVLIDTQQMISDQQPKQDIQVKHETNRASEEDFYTPDLFATEEVDNETPASEDGSNQAEIPLKFLTLHKVPNFQPMLSLKGNLKSLLDQIAELSATNNDFLKNGQTLWLEVTVIADEYLSEVQKRLLEAIEGLPIELLRVMRKSAMEKENNAFEARKTLSELTVNDVFQQSLSSNLEIEDNEAKILTELFNTCLTDMEEFQQNGEGDPA